MSSTRQHGASGSRCCKNSVVDPNNLGSRPTDRNKLLNASRTSGSSSTTRTIGVSGSASFCLNGRRCVTTIPSRTETRLPGSPRRPYVAQPSGLALTIEQQWKVLFLCHRDYALRMTLYLEKV